MFCVQETVWETFVCLGFPLGLFLPSVSKAWIWQTSGGSPSNNSRVVVKISIVLMLSTKTSLRNIMPVTKQDNIHKRVTYYSVRTCTIRDNNYIIKKVHDWQIHNKKGENILVRGIKALLGVLDKGFNSWNNLKYMDLREMT